MEKNGVFSYFIFHGKLVTDDCIILIFEYGAFSL